MKFELNLPQVFSAFVSLAMLLFLASCSSEHSSQAHPQWMSGLIEGHEILTRLSIAPANKALGAEIFPEQPEFGSNAIIRGNVCTDFPEQRLATDPNLLDIYPPSKSVSWSLRGDLADLHFTRPERADSDMDSAFLSCEKSLQRVHVALKIVLESWKNNDRERAFFFIGHTLHTLQDSFSPAHTRRLGGNFHILNDICSYEFTKPGVCRHGFPIDSNDFVDKDDALGTLKPEAEAAVQMSIGYLSVLGAFFKSDSIPINEEKLFSAVNEYFTIYNPTRNAGSGAFACTWLRGK